MIIERKGKWIVYLFNILYIIFFVFMKYDLINTN